MSDEVEESVLRSLRKISRAIDLHSRKLASSFNLTGPQLVCLRQILREGEITPSALARDVSLSQATITGIVTRLESRGLIKRTRSDSDRRRVLVTLTPEGERVVGSAPSPLQDHFVRRLHDLPVANQTIISTVLAQVVDMMGAEDIDASPLLATGPIDATAEAVGDLLEPEPGNEAEKAAS